MPEINHSTAPIVLATSLTFFYVFLFFLEKKWPLRKASHPLLPRLVVNFTFTVLVFIIVSFLIGPLTKNTMLYSNNNGIGLLPLLPFNPWILSIIGFLMMDLSFYYWHRINHSLPLLWRFHNVHHVDPDLDVSTSMRFHVVEILYSSAFRLVQLGLIGVNPFTFFCYELVFQANTFLQHSNLKLPLCFEKKINKILVTPRMHGIHHSNYFDETNSNYGSVFSFWDKLHKTLKLNVAQKDIIIGVPGYSNSQDNRLSQLLLIPFKSQNRYWQIGNNSHLTRNTNHSSIKIEDLCE